VKARVIAALRFLFGLGLVVAIVWWLLPGPQERQDLLARIRLDPLHLALAFVCTLVASLVTAARWQLMSERTMGGTPLPYLVYFHGLVLTRVLGQVSSTLVMDLVGRGVALRSAGSQRDLGHAVTQAIIERIFDIVLPLMMLAWAILAWQGKVDAGTASASFTLICILFGALSVVLLAPLTRLALRIYAALRRLRARRRPATADIVEPSLEPIALPRGLALRIGLLSLARYLTVLAQFWTIAVGFGISITFFQIAAATPLGQLAGMAGFTPGALGIQEAGWLGAFTWVGLDAVSIGLFVLSQRLLITLYFSILSLFSWLLLRRTRAAERGR
jgi:uncharacterized protein (TIRG00374 family)